MYLYILKHGNAAAVSYYGSSGWCSLLLLFIDFRFGPVQFPFLMRIYINLFSFPIFFTSSLRYLSALTLSASCAPMQQWIATHVWLFVFRSDSFSPDYYYYYLLRHEKWGKKKKKEKKEIPSEYCGRRTFSNWFGGITRWNSSAAAPAWRNHSISLQFFTWLDARPQHPHQQMIDTHADRRSK